MKGAKAIAESLKREKVKNIFGITGGAIMILYDALQEYEKAGELNNILCRHEQVAAHAAEGYARASGEVGVCMATSGPGATNLVTGIADAWMDSSSVVALTGQVATSLIGGDAFQEADIIGITMPIVKSSFQIRRVKDIPLIIKMAFQLARTGRPGPVLVDLPKDIQVGEDEIYFYEKELEISGYNPNIKGHPLQIKRAAKALLEAERPLIIAGGGVTASNASPELIELVEMLGIPVVTTLMGKGTIPEDHPYCLGMVGMHGKMCANLNINKADVILAVGMRFDDRVTADLTTFLTESKIIHIDIDSAEIGKNVLVDYPIVGDAKTVLRQLIEGLKTLITSSSSNSDKKTAWQKRIKEMREACDCLEEYEPVTPIKPQYIMKELQQVLDDDSIVVTGVGRNQMWAAHHLRIRKPRRFISSGGLGTMGFGFPASLGAKVAKPDSWVVDVDGDGSFLMTHQDLATSVVENIPVTVIILDDRSLGMVRQWQSLFFEKRFVETDLGTVPDFVKITEAYGLEGIRIENPSEIGPALREAKKADHTVVIDIAVDKNENVFPMVPAGGSTDQPIPCEPWPRRYKK